MRGWIVQLLATLGCAGTAQAAPWVRDDDGWYARALITSETLDGAEGWRADGYGEYGLTEKLTITAKAESVTYDGFNEFDREAFRLTLRRQLMKRGNWVAGAELGAVHGSTATGFSGCEGWGYEARAGAGYSGVLRERAFYAFGDVAYIQQERGCERQRAEFGLGTDIGENMFLTQQIWIENGNQSADSVKTESQIGIHFDTFDLSLGFREEIGGEFEETAVLIALVARR